MNAHATIDGRPVQLKDWSCDSTVNWGYRSLTGHIPESVTWAEQEAPIRLWLPDDTELWSGRIALDPETDRGMRSIRAEGYAQDLVAATTRMCYRIDGGEPWVEADADPHEYVFAGIEAFDLNSKRNQLAWKLGDGSTAFATNDRAGYVLWVEGGLITRYSILVEVSGSFGNMNLQGLGGTGPSGSLTVEGTHSLSLGAGGTATYNQNLTTPVDLLCLRTNVTGAFTPARRQRVKVTRLKVYGRTIDDAFSASEVVDDVGGEAGMDTSGVQSNALAVLPLDWTEDHPDLLDYMAELCDWQWQVVSNADGEPALTFGPYETTWTAYQDSGVRPNWESQKRFNQVEVPYTSISGRHRSVIATAADDPFPGQSVVYTTEPLEDPQQDATLATAAATAQTAYWASKRVSGRIELGRVYDEPGASSDGGHVRPGHLIDVAERPDLGPQRIVAMNYRESGPPIAEINDDFNVLRLLAQVQDDVKPGRRKKRKHRHRK